MLNEYNSYVLTDNCLDHIGDDIVLLGVQGVSAECFFAGVCAGGLITLPLQVCLSYFRKEIHTHSFHSTVAY